MALRWWHLHLQNMLWFKEDRHRASWCNDNQRLEPLFYERWLSQKARFDTVTEEASNKKKWCNHRNLSLHAAMTRTLMENWWGPGEISCSILSPAVFFALRLKHAFSNVTHAHQQKFIVEGSWSTDFIFDCTASLRPRPTNCRPRSSFIGNVKESRGISPQQQDKQKLLTNNSF